MREIKFRAWDHVSKEFIGKFHIISTGGVKVFTDSLSFGERGTWSYISEERCKLMQYTGLKDKNGKRIYEGDIVRILYSDWPSQQTPYALSLDDYMDSLSNVGVVIFKECEFCLQLNKDGYTSSILSGPHGRIKVIGNIYENKALLGEVKCTKNSK